MGPERVSGEFQSSHRQVPVKSQAGPGQVLDGSPVSSSQVSDRSQAGFNEYRSSPGRAQVKSMRVLINSQAGPDRILGRSWQGPSI
jgi:hypothetical protein